MMIVGLLTEDVALRDSWRRQIPESCVVIDILGDVSLSFFKIPPSNGVLIWDLSQNRLPEALHWRGLAICVGEPGSAPFEQAKLQRSNGVQISYGDSLIRIRDFLGVAIESNRLRSQEQRSSDLKTASGSGLQSDLEDGMDGYEVLGFVDSALEVIGSRGALLFESKRAIRNIARCSSVRFFFPRGEVYVTDCGEFSCSVSDPLLSYLRISPVLLDGVRWPSDMHPSVEIAIRSKMAVWGSRLLVPIHKDGVLEGVVTLSIREDGGHYGEVERRAVIGLVRVARRLLEINRTLDDLDRFRDESFMFKSQLPATLVLGPSGEPSRSVPSVIRDLIGKARREGGVHRLIPARDQPFRGKVGLDAASSRVWACWEDCKADFIQDDERGRGDRALWLRDLSMTLNHELGNALVPLAVLGHSKDSKELPRGIVEIVSKNIRYLEELNTSIASIGDLVLEPPQVCDLRDLVRTPCDVRRIKLEIGPDPVLINCCRDLLSAAISSIIDALHERRSDDRELELCARVSMVASQDRKLGLIALRGRGMELEGILPEPKHGDVPCQGRLLILLAKEIIKLHRGEVTVGPGLEGAEIRVSIMSL